MPLESVTHISDLVVTNPTSTDPKSEGDNHLRNIKTALKTDFPNISGPVTKTHTQLNNALDKTGDTMTGNLTVPSLNGGQLAGLRNKIINGKMEIAQRGTSFAAANGYTLDRWSVFLGAAGAVAVSQQADAPGSNEFQNSLRAAVTTADASIAAGDFGVLLQNIEGYNVRDLVGRTFTLSFWVRSSKTGVHCISFRNAGTNRSYVAEYTVSAADTWEKKSVTVPGGLITAGTWDWTNGVGLGVSFTMASGSTYQTTAGAWQTGNFFATSSQVNCLDTIGNIFAVTGVQLEVGSVATPFEHRPYGMELALCQRYYYRTANAGGVGIIADGGRVLAAVTARVFMKLPVPMRVVPSAIEVTGTTTDYAWEIGGGGFNGVPTYASITSNQIVALDYTGSGLTVGQAAYLHQASTAGFVGVAAEL